MIAHTRRLLRATVLAVLAASMISACASTVARDQDAPLSPWRLEQMLAPIALYPDPLLSHVLMASTYPLEVAEAARWSRANPGLAGDQAVWTVRDAPWDPAVKSLTAFPDLLTTMADRPEWVRDLGDAFLEQHGDVLDAVQRLRKRAWDGGHLRDDEDVRVLGAGPAIVIEPVHAGYLRVPAYDPRVVYGAWRWPDFPPVRWRPWPGYWPAPGVHVSVAWGPRIGLPVGVLFGRCDWPRREVQVVHVNHYYTRTVVVEREVHVHRPARPAPPVADGIPRRWHHEPYHRRGLDYRPAYADRSEARRVGHGDNDRARREDGPRATHAPVREELRDARRVGHGDRPRRDDEQRARQAPAREDFRAPLRADQVPARVVPQPAPVVSQPPAERAGTAGTAPVRIDNRDTPEGRPRAQTREPQTAPLGERGRVEPGEDRRSRDAIGPHRTTPERPPAERAAREDPRERAGPRTAEQGPDRGAPVVTRSPHAESVGAAGREASERTDRRALREAFAGTRSADPPAPVTPARAAVGETASTAIAPRPMPVEARRERPEPRSVEARPMERRVAPPPAAGPRADASVPVQAHRTDHDRRSEPRRERDGPRSESRRDRDGARAEPPANASGTANAGERPGRASAQPKL